MNSYSGKEFSFRDRLTGMIVIIICENEYKKIIYMQFTKVKHKLILLN